MLGVAIILATGLSTVILIVATVQYWWILTENVSIVITFVVFIVITMILWSLCFLAYRKGKVGLSVILGVLAFLGGMYECFNQSGFLITKLEQEQAKNASESTQTQLAKQNVQKYQNELERLASYSLVDTSAKSAEIARLEGDKNLLEVERSRLLRKNQITVAGQKLAEINGINAKIAKLNSEIEGFKAYQGTLKMKEDSLKQLEVALTGDANVNVNFRNFAEWLEIEPKKLMHVLITLLASFIVVWATMGPAIYMAFEMDGKKAKAEYRLPSDENGYKVTVVDNQENSEVYKKLTQENDVLRQQLADISGKIELLSAPKENVTVADNPKA